ncbi:MAG: carboxypeptidase regulatory-like domain-containing protein [Brachymonas sp.]|nr:carboxypeptidase regulatory-like domain-containing protein [Brachymonas sp.]
MNKHFRTLCAGLAVLTGLLAGCGGGGGGAAPATPAANPSVEATISGSVVKGVVAGGTVTVSSLSGTILGTTTTSPAGTYSLRITANGDVVVEVQGGTYLDEATGQTVTLNQLKAIISPTNGTQTVHLTPLTYLAYFYSGNTVAGFQTAINNIATQFGLGNTNLVTTLPIVSGTGVVNPYGQVLRAFSQYVMTEQQTTTSTFNLERLMGLAGTASSFNATFQTNFSNAFNTINPGQTLTFSFNGTGITIGGSGAGGGSGTCGVNITGSITANNITTPVNFDYCVSGIAAGSCTSGNTSLNQALSGQQGLVGATNLNYTFGATCAANAFNITLQ